MKFEAGRLKYYSHEWEKITTDSNLLDIVKHCHIEFTDNIKPCQTHTPFQNIFNEKENDIIDKEIQNLLEIGAIKRAQNNKPIFLSTIFVRPKKNGEFRVILNLKELNKFIPYRHFKMDTFESAVYLVSKDSFFGSIDLRHAYFSVPIAVDDQIYLGFTWKGITYQYTCLPFGIAFAPRLFTKLLKPVYASLRKLGHKSVGYIDDSFLCGDSVSECTENINATLSQFTKLGFVVHKNKSILIPTKEIVFLGNIINSETMTVSLPQEKKETIANECERLLNKQTAIIREVARVLGLIVSSFSAVDHARLYYREIEKAKIFALKKSCGNFDAQMKITSNMREELNWWFTNVHKQKRVIRHELPQITITTDASMRGWGAVIGAMSIGGRWTAEEQNHHINTLEMMAIHLALKSFVAKINNKHIMIRCDNTTAVNYITNMGGIKSTSCNKISKQIWSFCIKNDIWLSCSHIPGKLNILADFKSRKFNDQLEWKLNPNIFKKLCAIWQIPDIDLFASRLNFQVEKFCSWEPDPQSEYVNAFTLNWGNFYYVYLFPPFSLLNRCIRKIKSDKASGMMIVPYWPTQIWFPALMEIVTDNPLVINRKKNLLSLPHQGQEHPLGKKLTLLACQVSGKISKVEDFLKHQQKYLCPRGKIPRKNSMVHLSTNGLSTVVKGKLIKLKHL